MKAAQANIDAADIAKNFDLRTLPPEFYDSPYATYRALREHDPIRRLPDGGVFLTRFADMERVYKDTTTFSSDKKIEFLPKFGRTPLYEQGIGVPGCHAHYIDDSRTQGGHVLDFTLEHGKVELCLCTDLHLRLPLTAEFREAALSPDDLHAQLAKTEQHVGRA